VSPVRIIEERGRREFIKKYRDLQHILDHQAELQREIKLATGLKDWGRFWELGLMSQSSGTHPSKSTRHT
jgi:hypothetical protein